MPDDLVKDMIIYRCYDQYNLPIRRELYEKVFEEYMASRAFSKRSQSWRNYLMEKLYGDDDK